MATKIKTKKKKVTTVHAYRRHVAVSPKNPNGITIVDEHPRHFLGVVVTADDLKKIAREYQSDGILRPTPDDLDYSDGNKYDELIAIWVDFFNGKFPAESPFSPLDPNVFKALLGSESGFEIDPPRNKQAFGIAQITRQTLRTVQNPSGEAKDFIFKNIRQKDLKDPEIGIPIAVRWLFRKREMASRKLKRPPTVEELILEYKGMLRSSTDLKDSALANFRKKYDRLKKI